MPVHPSHFAPFISLGLLEANSSRRSLNAVKSEVQKAIMHNRPRSEQGAPSSFKHLEMFSDNPVQCLGFVYRTRETPSWWHGPSSETPDEKRLDLPFANEVNHLVLVVKRGRFFGIYTSHPSDWVRVMKGVKTKQIPQFRPVATPLLNGAFTNEEWAMGSVWMRGLHHAVETKADSKQLTGLNIRSAIDPYGDQTYRFASGRSKVPKGSESENLGISPGKHRIWLGQAADFDDFCQRASWALGLLDGANEVAAPIAELAHPLPSLDQLDLPDEVGWTPTGVLESWPPETVDAFNLLGGTSLSIDQTGNDRSSEGVNRAVTVRVRVIDQGLTTAVVKLKITYLQASNEVSTSVEPEAETQEPTFWEAAFETIFVDEGWGTLRYANGCVVSGTTAYLPRYSARPFQGWTWSNFADPMMIDITKEKPVALGSPDRRKIDLSRIGAAGEDSLFSWIHRRWGMDRSGILLCDDGSGEIADFLHLAPRDQDGESTLTLIHAKGSKKADPERGLSVSEYEVVVAQATKNLAFASPAAIAVKLRALSANARVWVDGAAAESASHLADELDARGPKVRLRVVVLQPHTRQQAYEIDVASATPTIKVRHAQLSVLLLEAEAACRSVGASFSVIASAT